MRCEEINKLSGLSRLALVGDSGATANSIESAAGAVHVDINYINTILFTLLCCFYVYTST